MSYFPEPYTHSKNEIKFELHLSNYATKFDLNRATGVDTYAIKVDLASLKLVTDDLDINKLKDVPLDLNKLSDV